MKFKEISILSNDWIYQNDVNYVINENEEIKIYNDYIKGYINNILNLQIQQFHSSDTSENSQPELLQRLNSSNTSENSQPELLQRLNSSNTSENSQTHMINQAIYNKYGDLVNQNQKLLLASIYNLIIHDNPNYKFDSKFPFTAYIDGLKGIDNNTKQYFKNILNNLDNNIIYDILNNIFETFAKYAEISIKELFMDITNWTPNSDSVDSTNGIVYTNKLIVENMNNDLEIKPTDTYLDFCCGSGGFLFDAYKRFNPLCLIGVEIDPFMTRICNLLSLQYNIQLLDKNTNQMFNKFNIINGNCFKIFDINSPQFNNYRYDKIAINPPYNINGKCDYSSFDIFIDNTIRSIIKSKSKKIIELPIYLNFILLGLVMLKVGGRLAAVIPQSGLQNDKFMNIIRSRKVKIIKVVSYDNEMFKESNVNVAVSHIVFERIDTRNEKYNFNTYYFDKGYKIIHKKINKYSEPKFSKPILININNKNWNYQYLKMH